MPDTQMPQRALPTALPVRNVFGFTPNSDILSKEKADRDRAKAEQEQNQEPLLHIADYLKKCWDAAYSAKLNNIHDILLKCARQRKGEYDPDVLAILREEGDKDPFYSPLTGIKCRAVKALLKNVMTPPGEKPYTLDPTPVPELPDEDLQMISEQIVNEVAMLEQEHGAGIVSTETIEERLDTLEDEKIKLTTKKARREAKRVEKHVEDQFKEGGFYDAFDDFLDDFVTYPAGILKGPIVRNAKTTVWTDDREGNAVPAVEVKPVRKWYNVSPFDAYPSPGSRGIQDGYFCEAIELRRSDLEECLGVPGFSDDAINGVLSDHGTGGLKNWTIVDQDRAIIDEIPLEQNDPDPPIDCVEFWGSIQGHKLQEWGMDEKQAPNANKDYPITAWLIGRWAVMVRINPHPLGHRPYYSSSYDGMNNQFWGRGVPQLMRGDQKMSNAINRALNRNLGMASGPQVEVFRDRMWPGADVDNVFPMKTWESTDEHGTGRPAVHFFQPDPLVEMLLKADEYYNRQADEHTGIPKYTYGNESVGGAGETASGLAMLMNAANNTLRGVVGSIDGDIVVKAVWAQWFHIMLYDDHIKKSGDIKIVARASEYLIVAEQLQLRLNEWLQNTNNPLDLDIIGKRGRAAGLREAARYLKLPTTEIVPDDSEMERREKMEAQLMRAQIMGAEQAEAAPGGGNMPPPNATTDAGGGVPGEQMRAM